MYLLSLHTCIYTFIYKQNKYLSIYLTRICILGRTYFFSFSLRLCDLIFWGQNHYPFAEMEAEAQRNENNCLWPSRYGLVPSWVICLFLSVCLSFCLSVYLSIIIFSLVHDSLLSLLSSEQVLPKHTQEDTAFADLWTLKRHFLRLDVATYAFNSSTKGHFL